MPGFDTLLGELVEIDDSIGVGIHVMYLRIAPERDLGRLTALHAYGKNSGVRRDYDIQRAAHAESQVESISG